MRIQRRGSRVEKFFADNQFEGKRKALQAAKEFRDETESELRPYSVKELAKRPSIRNTSGTVGVRRVVSNEVRGDYVFTYAYWVAQWIDGKGKRRTRSFSIDKYGEEEAQELATQSRSKGVNQAKRLLKSR